MVQFGGNPSVVICTPDIRSFKINETHDFIVLGSKIEFLTFR